MRIYNSLTRQIEEFTPISPPQVGMYTCGPTVYDFMHIGNLRTFILSDLLIRVLKLNNYQMKSVRNITDIDDKIIARAKEKNLTIQELVNKYSQTFFADLDKLNILAVDVSPKATEHIKKMVKYVEELVKKGVAYEKDGSVYFDISKFPEYGKLSGLEDRTLKTGTRILSDEYSKDDVQDFALWKAVEGSPSASSGSASWDSPWGRGRPGWHIECSVMSQEYLTNEHTQTIDLHVGGVDLLFPHHENEIAQAEAKTSHKFVNFFVHGEHILVDGEKMSKSKKNFYTIDDIKEKGFDPLALRYLFLTAHYRDKINFTWESLQAAQNALNNLRDTVRDLETGGEVNKEYEQKFLEAVNGDLGLPKAVVLMHQLLSDQNLSSAQKAATILKMDQVFGLDLEKYLGKKIEIPEEIQKLVDQREEAKRKRDYTASDIIRDKINSAGFEIDDTPVGPKIKKK